jgi:glycosyltransferase involved in cell wall biosynthesis
MASKCKVLIAPGYLPHYRDRFYQLLGEFCAATDIQLTVAASRAVPSNLIPGQFAGLVNARITRAGPFAWQDIAKLSVGCDLVIAQQEAKYLANYFLQLKRLVSPQRFAFWGHGKNFQSATSDLVAEYLKRWTSLHCDWWFAYNDASASIVANLGYPVQRITSVMNAIDTAHLTALKKALKPTDVKALQTKLGMHGQNVAVFTGGLYDQKRLRFLVDACNIVRQKIPDFELIVIGSGPESAYLERVASRNQWLHFVGPKDDAEKVPYWAMAKALVMPGLVGLVVLDSFALGVPIITTNYPDHSPEFAYIRNGVNGIVTSPWPSLRNYAEQVVDFFLSPELQQKLTQNALASAQSHTIEIMAHNFFQGITMALKTPRLRFCELPKRTLHRANASACQGKKFAIATRSLSPYTREFFDCLAQERESESTTLVIGRRESDWINPWNSNLLIPQVANYVYANATTSKGSRRLLLPSRGLMAALERIHPRLVAIQECSGFSIFAAVWSSIHSIPYLLITEIGDNYGPPYPALSVTQRILHRITLKRAAGVIALSPDARRRAEKAGKQYVIAPHAINTARYRPRNALRDSAEPVILMSAGNFIFRKGYDLLIKALAHAHQNLAGEHRWILRCYGAGDKSELLKLARKVGIADMVEFHSFLDEVQLVEAYQSADIFAFPSRKETYGIVLHEAASCGLPLVASIHAGATELLAQEGENALRVDPENTTQFASALQTLIRDKNLRHRFGIKSRSIAETWDVKKNAQQTKLWIESLLV